MKMTETASDNQEAELLNALLAGGKVPTDMFPKATLRDHVKEVAHLVGTAIGDVATTARDYIGYLRTGLFAETIPQSELLAVDPTDDSGFLRFFPCCKTCAPLAVAEFADAGVLADGSRPSMEYAPLQVCGRCLSQNRHPLHLRKNMREVSWDPSHA